MHGALRRDLEATLSRDLAQFPAVSLVGPRQCGKTTLAKRPVAACSATGAPALHLDLERSSDRQRIAADPETFECKALPPPRVTRGFWTALQDLEIQEAFVVAPLTRPFPMGSRVEAVSVEDAVARLMA